jgi:drug/metabolite transporter (DMT)-like permease
MELTENKNKLFTNTAFIAVAALLCCALWGSATPFIKIGYELILPERNVPSTILFAGIRFTLAGIITVLIYSIAKRRVLYPKKENIGRVLTVSAFQTVIQYIFFYIGLSITSGVKGTVISGSNAFFAILISALIFRQEKLNFKKIIACILGFAGIIVVNISGLDFTMNVGDLFVMISNIAYAVSSVLIKRFSKYEDPVVISGYQFIIGGSVMIAAGAILGGRVSFDSWGAIGVIIYLALLSAVAYSLWGILLKHNPVSKVTIYSFMIPVFGVLLTKLLLPKTESNVSAVNLIITLVLICVGIIILNYKKPEKKTEA